MKYKKTEEIKFNNNQSGGGQKSTAMKYDNCIQPALLYRTSHNTMVEVFCFPELLVLSGTVGKLVQEMIALLPNKEAGKNFVNLFLKKHNISWVSTCLAFWREPDLQALSFVNHAGGEGMEVTPLHSAIP